VDCADHESPTDSDAIYDRDSAPGLLGVVGSTDDCIEVLLGGIGAGDVGQLGVGGDCDLERHGRKRNLIYARDT
jgi:hypothetical protein